MIKQGYKQPRKYPGQANVTTPSDIYFVIDEFHVFIKNVDAPPAEYIISRQKKIARLLKKDVFKVVTSVDIWTNFQFLFCEQDKKYRHW